ncbi:UNVERIFIED_CONTAM: Vesicle-trafficking protein SEC22b-A, partial [Eudyptes robustus]|uniref:(pine wood nematode) hypothetical protein n=1 Tax=Bursaphelenchus xylophilus TaxID=6326 RepID=A0A1I7SF67_BURXY
MVLQNLIARVSDGLILATSIEGADDPDMVKYTTQAKKLFRKLNTQGTPNPQIVESGPYLFYYIVKGTICALALCERNFPRQSAFSFLEDVANEFIGQYGTQIDKTTRPYHFLEFDTYIQQAKRKYGDRNRFAMSTVSSELQDVTRIMVSNIEDVIHRGEALNILETRASDLSDLSKKYREDARQLNRRSAMIKIFMGIGIAGAIFLFLRFFVF